MLEQFVQAAASQLRELNETLRQKRLLRESNVSPRRPGLPYSHQSTHVMVQVSNKRLYVSLGMQGAS